MHGSDDPDSLPGNATPTVIVAQGSDRMRDGLHPELEALRRLAAKGGTALLSTELTPAQLRQLAVDLGMDPAELARVWGELQTYIVRRS